VSDVGSALYEEVNLVERGGNYGWPVKEGQVCIEVEDAVGRERECPEETPAGTPIESLVDPILQYPHFADGDVIGLAVVGGHVYRGGDVPALTERSVLGDYSSSYEEPGGTLFVADFPGEENGQMSELTIANAEDGALDRSVLSIGRDSEGELYVLTTELPPSEATDFSRRSGEVYKIIQRGQADSEIGSSES